MEEIYPSLEKKYALLPADRPRRVAKLPVYLSHRSLMRSQSLAAMSFLTRRHPVVTVTAGVLMSLAAAFLILLSVRWIGRDINPVFSHYNPAVGKIEIYNKENKLLWDLPVCQVAEAKQREESVAGKLTILDDLDGDGKKELVTTLPLETENMSEPALKIFNADGSLRKSLAFPPLVKSSHGMKYSENCPPSIIEVVRQGKTKEVVAVLCSGRSPNAIARISPNGEVLGIVWFYGGIGAIAKCDEDGDGNEELIVSGVNDVEQSAGGRHAVVIVIDPQKITGETESVTSRGFGLPASSAEKISLRLPSCDMLDALHDSFSPQYIKNPTQDRCVCLAADYQTGQSVRFFFYFTKDLHVVEVKGSDGNELIHARLCAAGSRLQPLDEVYLGNLKNGVRYWDGAKWQTQWTLVWPDAFVERRDAEQKTK